MSSTEPRRRHATPWYERAGSSGLVDEIIVNHQRSLSSTIDRWPIVSEKQRTRESRTHSFSSRRENLFFLIHDGRPVCCRASKKSRSRQSLRKPSSSVSHLCHGLAIAKLGGEEFSIRPRCGAECAARVNVVAPPHFRSESFRINLVASRTIPAP